MDSNWATEESTVFALFRKPASEYPDSPPWSATLGGLLLTGIALYNVWIDGENYVDGTVWDVGSVTGAITLSPLAKGLLLALALGAAVYAVGVRLVEWGPMPFALTILGAILSAGYIVWLSNGRYATSLQYHRLRYWAFLALVFFGVAVLTTVGKLRRADFAT